MIKIYHVIERYRQKKIKSVGEIFKINGDLCIITQEKKYPKLTKIEIAPPQLQARNEHTHWLKNDPYLSYL